MKSESVWSKALEISRKAVNCGAVIPLNTIKYQSNDRCCDYELRFLKSPIPKYLIEYGPKRNPFIPWDTRLQIDSINDKHTLKKSSPLNPIDSVSYIDEIVRIDAILE